MKYPSNFKSVFLILFLACIFLTSCRFSDDELNNDSPVSNIIEDQIENILVGLNSFLQGLNGIGDDLLQRLFDSTNMDYTITISDINDPSFTTQEIPSLKELIPNTGIICPIENDSIYTPTYISTADKMYFYSIHYSVNDTIELLLTINESPTTIDEDTNFPLTYQITQELNTDASVQFIHSGISSKLEQKLASADFSAESQITLTSSVGFYVIGDFSFTYEEINPITGEKNPLLNINNTEFSLVDTPLFFK